MNEFVTYVLLSPGTGKIYIGFTSDLINRINSHNHFGTKGFTLKFRPWIVVYTAFFDSKSVAMKHEKLLKSGKGREYIHKQLLIDMFCVPVIENAGSDG